MILWKRSLMHRNTIWARGYRKRNPEICAKAEKKWRENNRDKLREIWSKRHQRRKKDPVYQLTRGLRDRIRKALRGASERKRDRSVSLLGCTPRCFKQHLEALFLPGMSWGNRSLWHIDHKKPLASFDLSTEAGQRAAFHYTNTQPLWAVDNLRKGARII